MDGRPEVRGFFGSLARSGLRLWALYRVKPSQQRGAREAYGMIVGGYHCGGPAAMAPQGGDFLLPPKDPAGGAE